MVQQPRLCDPAAGGLGLVPDQGTGSHMAQLKFHVAQLKFHVPRLKKVPCATAETWRGQINT